MAHITVLWTIAAVVGAVVSAANAWDAWLDLRALAGEKNGRRVIARTNLRSQLVRAVQMVSFAAPGTILAFELVPAGDARAELVVWFLLGGVALATSNSTLDRFAKRRLLHDYARQHPVDDPAVDGIATS